MPKKYTANDRLNFVKFLRAGQLSELTQMSKKLPQFPWENAEDAANLEAVWRACRRAGGRVCRVDEPAFRSAGTWSRPIDEAFRLAGDPGGDHGRESQGPELEGATDAWGHPDLEGTWTSDDMRGIPTSRPAAQGERESLTPEEFARRAGGDEASRDRAVNQETILRNEFGVRTFGYTSFIVDPPNGQMPALTQAALARRKAISESGHVRRRSVGRLRRLHALQSLHHARRPRHR